MIRLRSGCKLNLGLRVIGTRADGYHDLESLFYPLPYPCDSLLIGPARGAGIVLGEMQGLEPQKNLVYKAYHAFADATGHAPAIRVSIVKRVPMGAGLGGGSANAACMLAWLNQECHSPLAQPRLLELAAGLGADVPFFLINRPCLVTGKGEHLTPVAFAAKGYHAVVACPAIHVATASAFHQWDAQAKAAACENSLTKLLTEARSSNAVGSFLEIGDLDFHNDLESTVLAAHPELFFLKQSILKLGACAVAMSGSGSAIYGIFDNPHAARSAASVLRKERLRVYGLPMHNFGM